MKIIRWMALLLVLAGLLAGPNTHLQISQAESVSCPQIVSNALTLADKLCEATGRNQACYGHGLLEAQPQPNVQTFTFEQDGDLADVSDVQSLRLGGMDVDSGSWGVALLRLQANLSRSETSQNLTVLLFGNVEVDNRMSTVAQAEVLVKSTDNVNIRREPDQSAAVIGSLVPNETATATGRLADNSWVRVMVPANGRTGWVAGWLLEGEFEQLEVVESGSKFYGPMQAFYFESGQNDSVCQEAPDSGLLIQTPEGGAEVTFLINEVDVQLGSTVYFQAQPDGDMTVSVVEGSAQVTAFDLTYQAVAGTKIILPLDENLIPAGPPLPPVAYDPADVAALPLGLLERSVVIAPPATEEEILATAQPIVDAAISDVPLGQIEGDIVVTVPAVIDVPAVELPTVVPPLPTEVPKVTLCHNENTISVDADAVAAHLAHGDTLGACP